MSYPLALKLGNLMTNIRLNVCYPGLILIISVNGGVKLSNYGGIKLTTYLKSLTHAQVFSPVHPEKF